MKTLLLDHESKFDSCDSVSVYFWR